MRKLLAIAALTLLTGCPTDPARDTNDRLVQAVQLHDGLVRSTIAAMDLGMVTPAQGRQGFIALVQAKAGLDAVKTALRGCVDATGQPVVTVPGLAVPAVAPTPGDVPLLVLQAVQCSPTATANDQLLLANRLLTQLALYYQARGVK